MTDVQKFIVAMSQAWAWPIVTAACVYLLREAIKQLATRLRSAKYGEFQADFGEELAKAEHQLLTAEPLTVAAPTAPRARQLDNFDQALRFAPSYAVLLAWQAVETELISLARKNDVPGFRPVELGRQLASRELIDEQTYGLLDELRTLRNKVVHNVAAKDALTAEQAERYGDLAVRVIERLRSKGQKD
jgi:uncharacterized protein YutE (UPF0331/DUF86 family)